MGAEEQKFQRYAYFGEYDIEVKNGGQTIFDGSLAVNKADSCDYYNVEGGNLVSGGDFDDDILDPMIIVENGRSRIHWDGYVKVSFLY